MRLTLDPRCLEARRLQGQHARAEILLTKGLEASRLAQVLDEQRDAALCAHLVACARCQAHMRTCDACGADLALRPHRFTCAKNPDRWRALLMPPEPPMAHLAPSSSPRQAEPAPATSMRRTTAAAPRAAGAAPESRRPAAQLPTSGRARTKASSAKKRSAWEILGLKPGAPPGRVKEAYHEAAMMYHPDRVAHLGGEFRTLAEERMREINEAYRQLSRS